MSKATHKGECQICGSMQKLPSGRLSLHGYTVAQWGFFNGVCGGSKFKPFEVSTDRIEQAVAQVTARRDALLASAAEVRAMTGTDGFHYRVTRTRNNDGTRSTRSEWVSIEVQAERRDAQYTRYFFMDEGKAQNVEYIDYAQLLAACEDQRAAVVAAGTREKRAQSFERDAKGMTEYLNWQAKRLADWAPRELRPV